MPSSRLAPAIAVLLAATAAAQDGRPAPEVQPPAVPASAPDRSAMAEDARLVAASALGSCFRKPPPYPVAALRSEQQGRTVVAFEVSAAGVAERAVLLRSSRVAVLDEAALRHLQKCIESTAGQTQGRLPPGRYALPLVWRIE